MSKNKTAKEKRPWHILIWLILYLVNLLAALAFQYFFIHTYSAPLTAESLGSISYFNGCEILDISGEGVPDNSLIGKSSPDWILYKNQAGETHAVRIEWNLYMPRFRISMIQKQENRHQAPHTIPLWHTSLTVLAVCMEVPCESNGRKQ